MTLSDSNNRITLFQYLGSRGAQLEIRWHVIFRYVSILGLARSPTPISFIHVIAVPRFNTWAREEPNQNG